MEISDTWSTNSGCGSVNEKSLRCPLVTPQCVNFSRSHSVRLTHKICHLCTSTRSSFWCTTHPWQISWRIHFSLTLDLRSSCRSLHSWGSRLRYCAKPNAENCPAFPSKARIGVLDPSYPRKMGDERIDDWKKCIYIYIYIYIYLCLFIYLRIYIYVCNAM